MNQQGVDWLEMALQPQKWPKKAKKWPKMVNFHKYLYAYGVGILNLSQEMSDEMHNESTRVRLARNGPTASKMAQ